MCRRPANRVTAAPEPACPRQDQVPACPSQDQDRPCQEHTSQRPSQEQAPLVSSLPAPPKSLPHTRKNKFASNWCQVYAEEIEKLQDHSTFVSVPRHSLPKNTIVPRAQMRFAYKEDDDGYLVGFKARIVYPDDRLTPGVHYDAKETSTYSADRDALRLVIAIAS